ncbi:hypothetical protein T484DRAFT_1771181 [Baffinella frigidus]|nr:hypothetical protein T484DRAFT_1771181 [Cryptophyta sp. CCMP2293]
MATRARPGLMQRAGWALGVLVLLSFASRCTPAPGDEWVNVVRNATFREAYNPDHRLLQYRRVSRLACNASSDDTCAAAGGGAAPGRSAAAASGAWVEAGAGLQVGITAPFEGDTFLAMGVEFVVRHGGEEVDWSKCCIALLSIDGSSPGVQRVVAVARGRGELPVDWSKCCIALLSIDGSSPGVQRVVAVARGRGELPVPVDRDREAVPFGPTWHLLRVAVVPKAAEAAAQVGGEEGWMDRAFESAVATDQRFVRLTGPRKVVRTVRGATWDAVRLPAPALLL